MKMCDNQVLKIKKGEKFVLQTLQLGLECVHVLKRRDRRHGCSSLVCQKNSMTLGNLLTSPHQSFPTYI